MAKVIWEDSEGSPEENWTISLDVLRNPSEAELREQKREEQKAEEATRLSPRPPKRSRKRRGLSKK